MFELILPYVLLITLVLTGGALWAKWMVQRAANQIEERHRAVELIVNDGEVPLAWIAKLRQRVWTLRREGGSETDLEAVADLARSLVGRKLDELIKYLTTTRLVADETTRDELMTGIAERRREWDEAGWRHLIDPPRAATHTPVKGSTAS